jgi:hypothetical protein
MEHLHWSPDGLKDKKHMGNIIPPQEDAAMLAWLNNFAEVCGNNIAALSLNPTLLEQITDARDSYSSGLANVETTKQAYRGAVQVKGVAKTEANAVVRSFAKRFKAIPGISPGLLAELGILPNSASGPVVTVTGLTVVGCDDGVNRLKWNRTNNSDSTIFIVEFRLEGSSVWNFAAAVTKVTFMHDDQTPGQKMYYRITSVRGDQRSVPCPPVVVYGNLDNPGLSLAA